VSLFSPPVGMYRIRADYYVVCVSFAFDNDLTEFVRVNCHFSFFRFGSLELNSVTTRFLTFPGFL